VFVVCEQQVLVLLLEFDDECFGAVLEVVDEHVVHALEVADWAAHFEFREFVQHLLRLFVEFGLAEALAADLDCHACLAHPANAPVALARSADHRLQQQRVAQVTQQILGLQSVLLHVQNVFLLKFKFIHYLLKMFRTNLVVLAFMVVVVIYC